VLDLTPAGGVVAERVTENLVRGAAKRAAGHLRSFSFNRVPQLSSHQLFEEVIESDGAELHEVNTDLGISVDILAKIFAVAPRLHVLNATVGGNCTELRTVLRNEPPYGPLRVGTLHISLADGAGDVSALAAAVASHESLNGLQLWQSNCARRVNVLLDAATERCVAELQVVNCVLDADSVPALARLLLRGSLTKLDVSCDDFPGGPEASTLTHLELLWAAVRSCRTLTHLELHMNVPNGANRRYHSELLDAAAALPALSELKLSFSEFEDKAAAGRALGAFLAADPPSLRTLRLQCCGLGDEGLAPLLDGLAANTHLRELDCEMNYPSAAFERDRLEPALAALAARAQLDA
jgi:hypothetical protein